MQTILPENKEHWLSLRVEDVTSTEAASLFGLSPYSTEFELFYRKKARTIVAFEENDRMKWGTRLERSIAEGIAEDQGFKIRPMKEYIRDEEIRMGASFDFAIEEDGLLEIKNVDSLIYRDGWLVEEENVEAPPHIEIQVQCQLAVSGRKYAYIGALIGGNRVVLIKREPDEKVISAIRQKVKAFWARVAANDPPDPDFEKDSEFIISLNQFANPGKIIEADDLVTKLCDDYREASKQESEAKTKKEAAKAQILMAIGDAEKVKSDLFSISAGVIGPAHVEFDRAAYRNFRVTFKKEKKS